jgi:restriction system protein
MVPIHEREVWHAGLNKRHVLRGRDPEVLRRAGQVLAARWDEMWQRKQNAGKELLAREASAQGKEGMLILAEIKTEQAAREIHQLENILSDGITNRIKNHWNLLKDQRHFPNQKPADPHFPPMPDVPDTVFPPPPKEPVTPEIPKKPIPPDLSDRVSRDDPRFQPVISAFDRMIPGRVEQKTREAEASFLKELEVWTQRVRTYNAKVEAHNVYLLSLRRTYQENKETYRRLRRQYDEECNNIRTTHQSLVDRTKQEHDERVTRIRAEHVASFNKWEQEKSAFYDDQRKINRIIDERGQAYLKGNVADILEYCDVVLSSSEYPDYFPQEFELDYIEETQTLLVDYCLPKLEDIPTIKAWKYIHSKHELSSTLFTETFRNKLYDDLICQIALRSLYELFAADAANALESTAFNGRIRSIDKSTGQPFEACILSVHVKNAEFNEINLVLVEPRACIKKLKGVASSMLHQMAAVAPILQINRSDKRFVPSYEVAGTLDDSANLAAMDWEDCEHLIRELFESEFSANGSEVKVTQASRDGGVDAVAFDPDPIRGGKIVIQAKRCTNVVGVAAVRDLWGTISHEGAMKGILVITSTYGPDAYEFAKGKLITLLDGANLLHLLERHGHRARIDIAEARKVAASGEKRR